MEQQRRLPPKLLGVILLAFSFIIGSLTAWSYFDGQKADAGTIAASPDPATVTVAPRDPNGRPAIVPVTPEAASPNPASSTGASSAPVNASPAAPDPDLTARSAYLMSKRTGAALYEKSPDEPLPMASTAKIITALTVLRYARPEEVVTIAPEDVVDPVLESSMGLQAGDMVTVRDLLIGLLLPSGNDAARALARFVGPRLPGDPAANPVKRFVSAMNEVAAGLGMAGSHFVHPAGDDGDGQVATARGLALAAKALLAQPALLPIVAMPHAAVHIGGPNTRVLTLDNTNELLSREGVYGVKTGTTPAAKQCLVFAFRNHGDDVVGVILGSDDRYADANTLLARLQPHQ